MEFVVPAVPPTELASPAASAVPASPSSPPSPPRRRGTKLGLLLHRTETLDHPCVPLFYFTLKGDPDLGELRTRVNAALGRFERFRSTLEGDTFVDDRAAFRIERHVRELSPSETLGGPPTMDRLRLYLEQLFTTPMRANQPMWELLLIRGFPPADGGTGSTRSVLIARVHHVIVDGTAAVLMLGALSDEAISGHLVKTSTAEIDGAIAKAKARVAGGCGPVGMACGAASVLCKYAAELLRVEPPSPFRGLTGAQRSLAWASVDADESMRAARERGFTFNDVWMACLCYAMGDFMRQRQLRTDELHLSAGLPVSLHHPILPPEVGNSAGNRFGFIIVQLPLGPFEHGGREARLQAVHDTLMRAKTSPEALVSHSLASLSGCLPEGVVNHALQGAGNARTSVIMTNVRGPPDQLHVGGLALEDLFGFLPTPPGVGLGIAIGTYAGRASLSVACDRTLMGDSANELLGLMMAEHARYCEASCEARSYRYE